MGKSDVDKIKFLEAQLKKEKLKNKKQLVIEGFEGVGLTKLQYDFAVIRGSHLDNKEFPNYWCMKEAGSKGSQKVLNNLASRYMKLDGVRQVIERERMRQLEVQRLNADKITAELVELGKMCMGKAPIRITEKDEDGTEVITSKLVFNPTAAKGALELLGRSMKMFTDKLEATGADGVPLTVAREVVYVNKDNVGDAISG